MRGVWLRHYIGRTIGLHRLGRLGSGSFILRPATILCPHRVEIGDGVQIFERAHFSLAEHLHGRTYAPRLTIRDRTVIGPGVWFSCVGEIDIGPDVLIGSNVLISDSFHEYMDRQEPIIRQPMAPARGVTVSQGAFVGSGSVLMAGTTIGEGSYVAPNAVVTGRVPSHCVVAGNPAEIIRRWDPDTRTWIGSDDVRWRGILESLT